MNLKFIGSFGTTGTMETMEHTSITGTKTKRTESQKLCSLMPVKKKKTKKQSRRLEKPASLYTEDIGHDGIKTSLLGMGAVAQASSIDKLPVTKDEKRRRRKRMERFGLVGKEIEARTIQEPSVLASALSASRNNVEMHVKKNKPGEKRLIGTNTALEKPYLRLTTFPKAENVRPLEVLKKSLIHVKTEFIKNEDFDWANEQLKSMRQDLTVQGLRNKFVLEVYETHARVLLEHGDLPEFHQCQTMLRVLTSPTSSLEVDDDNEVKDGLCQDDEAQLMQSEEASDEFQAYSILYSLVQNSSGDVVKSLTGSTEVPEECGSIASSEGDRPACVRGSSRRHALQVVKAVVHDDYQSFFRLYESAPHLSAYLMDFLVLRVRKGAYKRIVAAYRPTLSVEHFRESLFFQDLEETRRFLKKNGAVFVHEQGAAPFYVNCKDSFSALS